MHVDAMKDLVGVHISSPPPPARRRVARPAADHLEDTIGEEGEAGA